MDRETNKNQTTPLTDKGKDNGKFHFDTINDRCRNAFVMRAYAYAFAVEAAHPLDGRNDRDTAMRELLAATREFTQAIRRNSALAEAQAKISRIECCFCGFVHPRNNESCPGYRKR